MTLLSLILLILLCVPQGVYFVPGLVGCYLLSLGGTPVSETLATVTVLTLSLAPLACWLVGVFLDTHLGVRADGLFARYLPLICLGVFAERISSAGHLRETIHTVIDISGGQHILELLLLVNRSVLWAGSVTLGLLLFIVTVECALVTLFPDRYTRQFEGGALSLWAPLRLPCLLFGLSVVSYLIFSGMKQLFFGV